PASAEIVLAGFLHHDKKAPEGPFGEWTGYYASGERAEPVLEVEAIYHRDDPIILGVPPNKPPYEPHRYREYLRSALLLRELKAERETREEWGLLLAPEPARGRVAR